MESSDRRPWKTQIDKKTGREVVPEPPYQGYDWKDGFVLRKFTPEEARSFRATATQSGAMIGSEAYEWVRRDEVDLDD